MMFVIFLFFSLDNKAKQCDKVIECYSQMSKVQQPLISYFTFLSLPRLPEYLWLSLWFVFFSFLLFSILVFVPNVCSFFYFSVKDTINPFELFVEKRQFFNQNKQ